MKASQMLGRQRTAIERYLDFSDRDTPPEELIWLIDWREFNLPHCSLYVVTPDNKWPCKIGISVAPRVRLISLQTSVWRPLTVARCFWCENQHEAKRLEKKIHTVLTEDSKWLHGEWFDMRPDAAAEMVAFCAAVEGIECNDRLTHPETIEWARELGKFDGYADEIEHKASMAERKRIAHFGPID